jgi:hypothetical protein
MPIYVVGVLEGRAVDVTRRYNRTCARNTKIRIAQQAII